LLIEGCECAHGIAIETGIDRLLIRGVEILAAQSGEAQAAPLR
jgi:hypothetical protein